MENVSEEYKEQEHANVILFPPLVGLVLIVTGIVLHRFFPLVITSAQTTSIVAGIFILLFGIGLQIYCLRVFKQAMTTPLFQKPTTNIVQSGPYARSRNPIYIAVFFQVTGLAFLVNSWWLLFVIPILYFYLRFGVIAREEQYLEQKFGEEYRAYQAKVARWL